MRRRKIAEPEHGMFIDARSRARKKGVPFLITKEDIRAVWPKDGKCPVFGVKLQFGNGRDEASASLDRIDSMKGYVTGNIAVVSLRANRIKNDATAEELLKIVYWMLE